MHRRLMKAARFHRSRLKHDEICMPPVAPDPFHQTGDASRRTFQHLQEDALIEQHQAGDAFTRIRGLCTKIDAVEFFRAGITIRTDDTGGGSLRGSSFVEQNLCLNLIIIDKAAQPLFSLRHLGSVERLADQFRDGLRAAQDSLSHFLTAWGFARRDDLVADAAEDIAAAQVDTSRMSLADFMEGFARGAIERELVPLRSRHGETERALRRMYLDDTSSDGPAAGRVTRAGLVNALTRYAHRVEEDPFRAEEIERSAAGLLWPSRGKLPAIPFVPVTV
jgi:hypothetical protein